MRRTNHDRKASIEDPNLPKYSIAVAADISGVPQQQLRRMEDSGLVMPRRSRGNTRRYSDNDLRQIAAVSSLADGGVNAVGIRVVLELRAEVAALRAEVAALKQQVADLSGVSAPPDQSPLAPPGGSEPPSGEPRRGRPRGTHGVR